MDADRRVAAWVDLVGDLVTHPTTGFPRALLELRLYETFDCQVSWNWLDPNGACGFTLHVPIPGWPTTAALRDMQAAMGHHPLVRWFAASGDVRPQSIGRVPTGMFTALGRGVIRDHLVPIGMEQQLSIPYSLGHHHHRAFVLARTGRDFTDEQMETALRIQPLFRLVDRQYRVLRRCAVPVDDTGLTGRELAVLRLLADGLTASSIAARLAVSPRTVHRHLDGIYRKLGVSDRVRAVLAAREAGVLDPSGRRAHSASAGTDGRDGAVGRTFAVVRGMPAA